MEFEKLRAHTEQLNKKMRTKTLLLTAALVAAGVASSMAQSNVYSLNIVGYVNIPVQAGKLYILNNPFDDGLGNDINDVLSTSMNTNAFTFDGSSAFTFTPAGGYIEADYAAVNPTNGSWGENTGFKKITPGTGFWYVQSGNGDGVLTFTGSVVLNSTNVVFGNNSSLLTMMGSAYPASTNLVALGMNWLAVTTFGLAGGAHDGDAIFRWNPAAQNFSTSPGGEYDFAAVTGWAGPTGGTNGPSFNVGEGFFYDAAQNTDNWIQSFTVN